MIEFDTYKSCLGCPHRATEPNCHASCGGYLARAKAREEQNRLRRERFAWVPDEEHEKRVKRIQSARYNRRRGS